MTYIVALAKKDIPLQGDYIIRQGSAITITSGVKYEYALWHHEGIYDLPEEYVEL